MKNAIRLAMLSLAITAAPAFAQSPQCGPANFDQARGVYTILNPSASTVNQQCYVTVYPAGAMPAQSGSYPLSQLVEGTYTIEISGGGGGGGGGASRDEGGGGGGAGAAPLKTSRYLAPGTYKLTIGTGGQGGSANGGLSASGNDSSVTNASTGQLVFGRYGADTSVQRYVAAGDGRGGLGLPGGSNGGSGGDSSNIVNSGVRKEGAAQSGGQLQTAGPSGMPGRSGGETGRVGTEPNGERAVQANAGGGGGASTGRGGDGESVTQGAVAGKGELGGGGGGGRGGLNTAEAGGQGGHGFIRLTLTQAAPVAYAPAPVGIAAPPVMQRYSLSTDSMFGFGQSTLRPAGEAKLDELVEKLRSVRIDSITNTGHADRIGSSELNQKISLERAQSVKAYLVSRGIESSRIRVAGKGETEPVTSTSSCTGPVSPALIACLAPDRRVDLEIVGTSR